MQILNILFKLSFKAQQGRENVGKIKEFVADHLTDIIIIGAGLFFILSCWWFYTANRTANEYHDVNDTVQQAQNYNRDARGEIKSASAEIDNTQKQLDNSVKRTNGITESVKRVKERTDSNSELIKGCQDIVDSSRRDVEEARRIFTAVDSANNIP